MRSSESSRPSPSRWSSGWRDALSHRIAPWTLLLIGMLFAALATAFAGGCSRTVLVSEASPVRIGPATSGRVYARVNGEWVLSQNRVEIPEGWYCVPPSYVEADR
jgi:hypothetical protein